MLQMTKEALYAYGAENIEGLLNMVRPILGHRCELYRRYRRKEDPNKMMQAAPERSSVPFEYYIVNMAQGYLAGKAPAYDVLRRGHDEAYVKNFMDFVSRIRDYNDDEAAYMELMHDYLITTAAYLYVYENEDNQVVYTPFDSRQTVAIYDYATPANLIGVVRTWNEASAVNTAKTVVEVITDQYRREYRSGSNGFELVHEEPLLWGDVPCTVFEEEDGIAIFEPALGEIDAYEQAEHNIRSMTQYNDAAKLLITGYVPENPATILNEAGEVVPNPARAIEEAAWMRALALFVGEGGDVKWLLKDINYSGLLEVQKSRHDKITILTGVPNMTDEAFASADNASALGYKLYALDQYSATADRVFRKGYLRLWELIAGRLNLKSGSSFDFRDVQITMRRNIPTDRDKSIDRAVKMKNSGLFSAETCINESSVEVDAADELEKVAAEEQADYDRILARASDITQEVDPE